MVEGTFLTLHGFSEFCFRQLVKSEAVGDLEMIKFSRRNVFALGQSVHILMCRMACGEVLCIDL